MGKGKALVAGAAVLVIIVGAAITKVDDWFSNEPTGPGSGDELPDDYQGEIEYNDGKDRGNGPGEPGPGSGDELPDDEPIGPGSGDELPDDYVEPTGPGSGDEITEDSLKNMAIASCNVINEKSTCVEYIGSYWKTPQVAALNCRGVGVYSNNSCPRPTSGGCRMNPDSTLEMVSWFYPYGGDPIAGENITYAALTCDANPLSHYIYGN